MPQPSIFISYSHLDQEWLDRLLKQLSILRREGILEFWSDKELSPGDRWRAEIEQAIDKATLAILLVSANFLDSSFIMEKELPALLKKLEGGKLRKIMPLIATPCLWKEYPEIAGLEVRPKHNNRDCLSLGNAAEQEKDIADFSAEVIKEFRQIEVIKESQQIKGGQPEPLLLPLSPSNETAVLEIQFNHREWDCYNLELAFMQSGSSEPQRPLRYCVSLDARVLHQLSDKAEYAQRLQRSLFPEDSHWDFVKKACKEAVTLGAPLHLRISIGACARELNCLHWELLGEGEPETNPLSFDSTYFIRYAGADINSWRDIRRRPRKPLTAGLVIASFTSVTAFNQDDANVGSTHLETVATAFRDSGIKDIDIRSDRNADDLYPYLRAHHPDILYLCIDLEKPATDAQGVGKSLERLTPLLQTLKEIEFAPRLVILAPWNLAATPQADESYRSWLPLMRLAYEIAQTGVIGVLTLQTGLTLQRWSAFLAAFLRNLSSDGQMDRSLYKARSECIPDLQWAPIVISGVRTGRVWYTPRFTDETNSATNWITLLSKIRKGQCTPVIGPELNSKVARARNEIALAWAESYHYPMALHERISLPQVSQYIASEYSDAFLYEDFEKQYRDFALRRFGAFLTSEQRSLPLDKLMSTVAMAISSADPHEPHRILAELPFRLYVTTSLNSFLSDTLRRANKRPEEIVLSPASPVQPPAEPTPERPLVFHFFGRMDKLQDSVLTEDDYFDFLIRCWRDRKDIPSIVQNALVDSSLLFLGFKIHQWDFRVLFRSLLAMEGSNCRARHMHIAVQIDPDDDQVTDPDRARNYLERYFEHFAELKKTKVIIFWGSAEDFLQELKTQWDKTP